LAARRVQEVEVRRGNICSRGGKQIPEEAPACSKQAFFLKAAASLFSESRPAAKTSGVGFEGRSKGKVLN
jgi:hypothetical protein